MTLSINPSQSPSSTQLYIGKKLLEGDLLFNLSTPFSYKIVLIADLALKDLFAEKLAKKLKAKLMYVESGEKAKTRKTKEKLENELLKEGYGRDTLIIALGGGSTTDVVGFLASTYMRGVPLILIPTTLLAMVDASIGGKTAINTRFGKNQIGTIYHPKAIISDLDVLTTLPNKEKKNGMAEILKIGLIANSSILNSLEDLKTLVISAAKEKIAVIEKDPNEIGLRRILNFGHTIGHALENISHYTMPHGIAVAIGSLVESYLSMHLGYLSKEAFEKIQTLYQEFLPFYLPVTYNRKKFLQALSSDKKNKGKEIRFVLIDRIGHAISFNGEYCRSVTEKDLEATLLWMEEMYGKL